VLQGNRLAGAILAGGRAVRFGGIAKGMIRLPDGRTIVERLVGELAAAGVTEVVLSTSRPEEYAEMGLPTVADRLAGVGPLAGVEASLAYHSDSADAVVFVACDLPAIGRAEVRKLIEAFAAGAAPVAYLVGPDGREHPLCAVVACGAEAEIAARIGRGETRVSGLWRALGGVAVGADDPRAVFNVNTPGDLAEWEDDDVGARAGHGDG